MVSVVIQAGGRSSRMGRDKAHVVLGGKALIEHVLERVQGLGAETLITTNDPESYARFGLRVAQDRVPGAGALHGLRTALGAAQQPHVLLVACDMPFIQLPLLEYLLEPGSSGDAIVPRPGGHYEPLLALYRREPCLQAVDRALAAGERRVISFYPSVSVVPVEDDRLRELDPHGLSFFNINDEHDLAQAELILASGLPPLAGGSTHDL